MSIVIIFYVLPILILSTILIVFQTRGKVLFTQIRIGKNAKRFKLLKFITMKESKGGRRLIKLGKYFRKTFTDELPQIFNLFKGDLSFVGPRPMRETEFEILGDDAFKELYTSVKPGLISLTSLIYYWQESNESDRHKIEIFYITNRNIKLDLRILLASFGALMYPKFKYS
jgi:lipopolysaccharide/colanic/teichoic acid biosynthesis glycosyltransferase